MGLIWIILLLNKPQPAAPGSDLGGGGPGDPERKTGQGGTCFKWTKGGKWGSTLTRLPSGVWPTPCPPDSRGPAGVVKAGTRGIRQPYVLAKLGEGRRGLELEAQGAAVRGLGPFAYGEQVAGISLTNHRL